MSLLKIARLGHPKIRNGAEKLSLQELSLGSTQTLIDDLIETMRDANGVGIAAPQVHVSKQIIVIEVSPDNPRYPQQLAVPLTILINPDIVSHSSQQEEDWEGCLSVPDLRGFVPRWSSVTVRGLERNGNPITLEAHGFFARVIQHEVDHLQGEVFLDRLRDLRTLTHLSEYYKFWDI